jgi:NAD(P)-dependent dehydrogenase (short-subunit alcohol dehydrogenase family)
MSSYVQGRGLKGWHQSVMGGRALPEKADVRKTDEIDRMVETAVQELGGVDILINKVGIVRPGTFAKVGVGAR